MTALLEFYYKKDISEFSEAEIGEKFAKLVYVLEWQSEQVNING